ncbi:MAG: VOC family protein [Pseudomonadota bacterium]
MIAVVLYVRDLTEMAAFYASLGLVTDELEPEGHALMTAKAVGRAPAGELCLVQVPGDIARQIEIASPPKARESVPAKLVVGTDSLDETFARLEAAGGRRVGQRWSFRGWHVEDAVDPEGNVIQLRAPI